MIIFIRKNILICNLEFLQVKRRKKLNFKIKVVAKALVVLVNNSRLKLFKIEFLNLKKFFSRENVFNNYLKGVVGFWEFNQLKVSIWFLNF